MYFFSKCEPKFSHFILYIEKPQDDLYTQFLGKKALLLLLVKCLLVVVMCSSLVLKQKRYKINAVSEKKIYLSDK